MTKTRTVPGPSPSPSRIAGQMEELERRSYTLRMLETAYGSVHIERGAMSVGICGMMLEWDEAHAIAAVLADAALAQEADVESHPDAAPARRKSRAEARKEQG